MLEALAQVYGLPTIDDLAAHHPASTLADPDDPAALIAWLCHLDSREINGAVLPVDAGFSAHLGAQLGAPRPAGPETGPSAGGRAAPAVGGRRTTGRPRARPDSVAGGAG